MKVLLTLPSAFFPADTGGKIRSLNIFSRLAKRMEIHAVSFAEPAGGIVDQMKDIFTSYTPVFRRETRKYSRKFYMEVLANQFSSWPYFLAKGNHPGFRAAVRELTQRHDFDLLLCDFLHTAALLHDFNFEPKAVFEHNVEFLLRKRKWQAEKRRAHKLVFSQEWRKTRTIEASVCRSFDHVITVSDEDERTVRDEFSIQHTSVIPAGVDTEFFRPAGELPQPGRLAFIGSMDWDPNEDGIAWFLREVYPSVRRRAPHVRLWIVGRAPSERLRAMAARAAGVEVTGWVADVRPFFGRAEVVIVPLRVGGGTRIKIPEAMAMAKPVVATPVGAEGLSFRDGKEICIAQPEDFAGMVVKLLNDPLLRNSIGAAARRAVVANYSWDRVAAAFEEILDRVAGSTKKERAEWFKQRHASATA
jgi:glycosyltransferase involved in cell wall biosynthesis